MVGRSKKENGEMGMVSRLSLVALVANLALGAGATAATIGFDPARVAGSAGDSFSMDIVVSELAGEIVSAYDLDIVYDPSAASVLSVDQPSSALGDPLVPEAFSSVTFQAGVVDIAAVSLLSDDELLLLQGGDSVVLATLEFEYLGGVTSIDFLFDKFNDVKGTQADVLPLAVAGAQVSPIPEPSAALVFACGLFVVGAGMRRGPRARGTARGPDRG